jgi:SET domain-containing protein
MECVCPYCAEFNCSACASTQCLAPPPPLVEIAEYAGMGRGVRALQRIERGAFLAEYTGVVARPDEANLDDTYAMASLNGVALVAAAYRGNWTRFLNHSCRASCVFYERWVGGRNRMLVRALRDVQPFEQLTVDYGDEYWTPLRLCRCGEADCRYDSVEKFL